MQTYQWSKRHAKQPDSAGLRPYVSEMQRVVEKTINHRPKHQEPPDWLDDAASLLRLLPSVRA